MSQANLARIAMLGVVCVSLFHLAVILGWIPYTIVWGGQLKSASDMFAFETISLIVNGFILYLLAHRVFSLRVISQRILRIAFWVLCAVFVLNTIGNLFAQTWFEKVIFTPLTAILAVVMFALAKHRE